MSVWLIAFEKIDFKQIAQTNLGRPLTQMFWGWYIKRLQWNEGFQLFFQIMYVIIIYMGDFKINGSEQLRNGKKWSSKLVEIFVAILTYTLQAFGKIQIYHSIAGAKCYAHAMN